MAEDGDSVSVHYTGTLNDGSTFDSSVGRDPLQFTIGQGQMIPGFENAVLGMQVGEKKTVRLKPAEAYGPHQENRVLIISRNELSEGMNPAVGDRLQMQTQSGGMVVVVVIETNEETVTIDGNHPLAGKALNFEIELVAIN